ncbi:MAG: hypothetical protein QY329_08240 [Anaerolineales bacterium]|nr:MAG: hypothetical protein QY329_08240 [Anaerolineales bacterium]
MDNQVVSQTDPSTDADRIALTSMFKAIAEYGRRVRLRRLAACNLAEPSEAGQSEIGDASLEVQQIPHDELKKELIEEKGRRHSL